MPVTRQDQFLFRRGFSDILGRSPVATPKAAVEIRKIAKTDVVGNGAHPPFRGSRLAQHAMSARETALEQQGGKRGAIALEQSLQIARRYAEMRGDAADRKIPAANILGNINLGCS